jgi:hypothetical protein
MTKLRDTAARLFPNRHSPQFLHPNAEPLNRMHIRMAPGGPRPAAVSQGMSSSLNSTGADPLIQWGTDWYTPPPLPQAAGLHAIILYM